MDLERNYAEKVQVHRLPVKARLMGGRTGHSALQRKDPPRSPIDKCSNVVYRS